MAGRFAYSRWDGTQVGFELDADSVLEEITDDLLYHGDLNNALRRLMQSGFRDRSGERLQGLSAAPPPEGRPVPTLLWTEVWRRESWNSVRARIEGDVPHIQVWINGALIRDWRDTANHAAGGTG